MNNRTLLAALLVFVAAGFLFAASPAAAQDPGPGDINLTIEPSTGEVQTGQTQNYSIVAVGPDTGIGAYSEIEVELGDASVASIISFAENKTSSTSQSAIEDNGTSLVLDTALLGNRYGAAQELGLAEFTVEATGSTGDSTSVAYNQSAAQTVLKNSQLRGPNEPSTYNVTAFNGGTFSITQASQPAPQPTLDFNNQTLGQDGNVTVANVDNDGANAAILVTYESGSDLIVAGVGAPPVSNGSVEVAINDAGGFPGNHTAHIAPVDGVSQQYQPGDIVSAATAANITDQETAFISQAAQPDPANFQVTIDSTNSPVTEGDTLDVTATVENTGDQQGTQTVDLNAGALGTDSTQVTLAGGANTQVTLSVGTGSGDAGSYTATVSSENDSVSTGVSVQAAPQPAPQPTLDFNDQILGQDGSVTVANVNTDGANAAILVTYESGSDLIVAGVGAPPVSNGSVEVAINDAGGFPGNHTAHIAPVDGVSQQYQPGDIVSAATAANITDQETAFISQDSQPAPANFQVTIDSTNSPVTEGTPLEVTVTIENTGGQQGTQTVTLNAGALGSDSTTVTLAGSSQPSSSASTQETLSVGTSSGDAGSYTATVSTGNDSVQTGVAVEPSGAPVIGDNVSEISGDVNEIRDDIQLGVSNAGQPTTSPANGTQVYALPVATLFENTASVTVSAGDRYRVEDSQGTLEDSRLDYLTTTTDVAVVQNTSNESLGFDVVSSSGTVDLHFLRNGTYDIQEYNETNGTWDTVTTFTANADLTYSEIATASSQSNVVNATTTNAAGEFSLLNMAASPSGTDYAVIAGGPGSERVTNGSNQTVADGYANFRGFDIVTVYPNAQVGPDAEQFDVSLSVKEFQQRLSIGFDLSVTVGEPPAKTDRVELGSSTPVSVEVVPIDLEDGSQLSVNVIDPTQEVMLELTDSTVGSLDETTVPVVVNNGSAFANTTFNADSGFAAGQTTNISASTENDRGQVFETTGTTGLNTEADQAQVEVFRTVELTGDVVNGNDDNVKGAVVQLTNLNTSEIVGNTTTGTEGSYVFTNVETGDRYGIEAFARNISDSSETVSNTRTLNNDMPVNTPLGGEDIVVEDADPTDPFVGRVTGFLPPSQMVSQGGNITASANVRSEAKFKVTQEVTLSATDESTGETVELASKDVELTPDSNTTVSFTDVNAGALDAGEYTLTVSSETGSASGNLTVQSGLSPFVAQFDTNQDGSISSTELGGAASDYASNSITSTQLGEVASAYAQS
jgi:hypothetical protein